MKDVLRNVLAAVAGYVAMFAIVFIGFSFIWMIVGADGAFRPGSWEVSTNWILASIALGLLAAVFGGLVCERLGANSHALYILLGLIVLMAVLSAMPDGGTVADPGPRGADIGMFDAMSKVRQPSWLLWLNPLVGIVGAITGARLARRRTS